MIKREKLRDARDYDTTQLREAGHGRTLHRDYTAHFFRWSFAKRLIKPTDNVLEIGCGEDRPLSKILTGGAAASVNTYVGVDLNKLKPSNNQRLTFIGEFNFVERYKEVMKMRPEGYDIIVCLEVVEHFHSRFMPTFMKNCFACLKPGGRLILSTPVWDRVRMAASHINEMDIPTLQAFIEKAKFKVERRYGTFMDVKWIGKAETDRCDKDAILRVRKALEEYFSNDAISNIFGPLYPDHARNNIWIIRKPK